jgi:hypothetical protein
MSAMWAIQSSACWTTPAGRLPWSASLNKSFEAEDLLEGIEKLLGLGHG